MSIIETIGTKITRASLVKMGTDSHVEHFMVVTYFTNGDVTAGWSTGLHHNDMCFGKTLLDRRIDEEIFKGE